MTFGDIYCEDLDLILASKNLGNPRVKTNKVEIPGSSVTLDFTESFGIQYSNRTISLVFLCLDRWDDQYEIEATVRTLLHGQKMRIKFDEDESYYFEGRISLDSWAYYQGAGRVQMSIDCDPWRYKVVTQTIEQSVANWTARDYGIARIVNNGIRTVPLFLIASDSKYVKIGNQDVRIIPLDEEFSHDGLILAVGENEIQIKGMSAPIVAKWTERWL